jgi:hypothetical protein
MTFKDGAYYPLGCADAGSMADYYGEHDWTPFDDPEPATTWTTRDGRVLLMVDMSAEHLTNCLRMMDRAHAADPDLDIKQSHAYRGIQLELKRRNRT